MNNMASEWMSNVLLFQPYSTPATLLAALHNSCVWNVLWSQYGACQTTCHYPPVRLVFWLAALVCSLCVGKHSTADLDFSSNCCLKLSLPKCIDWLLVGVFVALVEVFLDPWKNADDAFFFTWTILLTLSWVKMGDERIHSFHMSLWIFLFFLTFFHSFVKALYAFVKKKKQTTILVLLVWLGNILECRGFLIFFFFLEFMLAKTFSFTFIRSIFSHNYQVTVDKDSFYSFVCQVVSIWRVASVRAVLLMEKNGCRK